MQNEFNFINYELTQKPLVEFKFIIIIAPNYNKMKYGLGHRGHHNKNQSLGRL